MKNLFRAIGHFAEKDEWSTFGGKKSISTNRSAQTLLFLALESGLTKFSLKATGAKFSLKHECSSIRYNYDRVDGHFAELSLAVQTKGSKLHNLLKYVQQKQSNLRRETGVYC